MLVLLGGNGFIGRHLTVRAHERGIEAVVVARTPEPRFLEVNAPSARSMSLQAFQSEEGSEVLLRADALVHLASSSVPISHPDTPADELSENVEPSFRAFLRVSRLRPELPILFLSSGGAVYGRNGSDRIPESAALRPISPYALGKVLTEQCLAYCGEAAGQRYAILRVSNPVGRWHRNPLQGLPMAALRAIRSGTPLEIFGDGSAVRDYLDADDLAESILLVAASKRPLGGVWNVASGKGLSVLEMVDLVGAAVGRKPDLVFRPARPVDVPRSVLDPSRFRADFGWSATTPLSTSLERLVQAQR
ncbi:MAG TPA: NAD-dependent epimerase/dehydratase family protein [Propylenella sp.]